MIRKSPDASGSVQVIDRLASLLAALEAGNGHGTLKVLAAETGLHPSTAFRILAAAQRNGLVERDERGGYRLGGWLLRLGGLVRSELDLRGAALPVMEWLRDQVEETVNLTVREGDEVVYVERVTPRRSIRVEQVIGSHAPLHVTAVGKLMLAEAGDDGIERYADRTGLPAFTERTLADLPTLRGDAMASADRGYALDNEEAEVGVGCIGVLIRDAGGQAVAGLSVSAPVERRRDAWGPLVMEAGRRISERLGYRPAERGRSAVRGEA